MAAKEAEVVRVVVVRIAVDVVYIQSILCSRTILCSRITCGRGILCSRAGVADGAVFAVAEYQVAVRPGSRVCSPSAWAQGCLLIQVLRLGVSDLTPLVSF